MKLSFRPFLALALVLALSPMAACAAIPKLPNVNAPIAGKTTLDEQLALSAEVGFAGATAAVEAAVDTGLLKGEPARQVRACYRDAHDALNAARSLDQVVNAAAFLDKVDTAKALFRQVIDLAMGFSAQPAPDRPTCFGRK